MTLLVLAAGMGSRFGGIKQLTPLTNEGEYIIDFTVYDALKAGFDNIIFVIRKDIEEIFEDRIGVRLRKNGVNFTYAYQERECKKIAHTENRVYNTNSDGSETELDFEDLVSMTCFGFTPDFYEKLNKLYYEFLEENKADFYTCEYILSEALKEMLANGARVKVLETDAKWCGVTYKEDSVPFKKFISNLKATYQYPCALWQR